jgi:lichenan operon transcriptional antiterminator
MCRTMQAEGVTDEYFLQDVLDRESRSSTAFGDQFAIPHSLTMNAHRSAISVMVTEEAIQWGGSNVRLVVLFAVSPNSGRLFRNVLDGAIRVLTDPVNVTTLIAAAGSHAEFVRALAGLLE